MRNEQDRQGSGSRGTVNANVRRSIVAGMRAFRGAVYFLPPIFCMLWPLPVLPMILREFSGHPAPIPVWPIGAGWLLGFAAMPGFVLGFLGSGRSPRREPRRGVLPSLSLGCGIVASLIGAFYFAYFFGPLMIVPTICCVSCLNLLRHVVPRVLPRE